MRISPLVIAAIAAFSISLPSQEQLVTFSIDTNPPEDDTVIETGTWVPAPSLNDPILQLGEFRILVHGYEGGWTRPVLDFAIAQPSEDFPTWLTASTPGVASQINFFGSELHPQCLSYEIAGVATFQRWVNFASTGGAPHLTTQGVGPWCQPFLTNSQYTGTTIISPSDRLWGATSYQWPLTSSGQVHGSLWNLLRSNPTRTSTFSAYSMLRYALVEQCLYQTGSVAPAAAFFQSNAWRHAIHGGWLELALQMFAIRSREVIKPPGGINELNTSINISQLPLAGISPQSKFLVRAPSEVLDGTFFLTGITLAPGDVHTFISPQATSPLMVRFRKVGGGGVTTEAFPTPTLDNPSAYTLTVPSTAKSGNVRIKDGGMTSFQLIGSIVIDTPAQ